ncbi:MAG TPA: hypothetical protein VFJ90_11980, partial [Candidatus Didemnitutus sp.]|nr:hypothetical protein [Candidatus Didemnitutus sp.]
ARVELPAPTETAAEARVRLAEKFPRTALRRMTHLGLLVGAVLDGVPLGPDDALVYATTFAETRALEDFLASFPAASPLLFQTSIHPGGVQQVLIGRQQPVARLWPLASRRRLVEQALLTALLEPASRVVLAGGEERGTWMLEHDMAGARPFAFATVLTRARAGALGRVSFAAAEVADEPDPALEHFATALAEKRSLRWNGAGGSWTIAWS